jgi:rhodanese-related sulfurtransferase
MKMIKTILPVEIYRDLEGGKKLSIIDVREDEEVREGMIPGAIHIKLGDLENRLNELDPNKEHIFVCRSGGRSNKACGLLEAKGFQVVNMIGGMTAWNALYKN